MLFFLLLPKSLGNRRKNRIITDGESEVVLQGWVQVTDVVGGRELAGLVFRNGGRLTSEGDRVGPRDSREGWTNSYHDSFQCLLSLVKLEYPLFLCTWNNPRE